MQVRGMMFPVGSARMKITALNGHETITVLRSDDVAWTLCALCGRTWPRDTDATITACKKASAATVAP